MENSEKMLKYSKDISVLLVEDYEELRDNISSILKNFLNVIDCASDGKKGLELYKKYVQDNERHYDIVLTDIRMPKMNGVELIQNIYEINSNQKVIIMSAHDEAEYLLPLINLGVYNFIKKPIDFDLFLDILAKCSKDILEEKKSYLEKFPIMINLNNSFQYDKKNKSLSAENEGIYVTKYEILFLDLLTTQVGKIYSNEAIVDYFDLNKEKMDMLNIRKLISKLRKKLPENTIESIYAVGYRIITV